MVLVCGVKLTEKNIGKGVQALAAVSTIKRLSDNASIWAEMNILSYFGHNFDALLTISNEGLSVSCKLAEVRMKKNNVLVMPAEKYARNIGL